MMPSALRGGRPVWFALALLSLLPLGVRQASSASPRATKPAHFQGHTSSVTCLAITPDGRTLATGSFDNEIRLWDLATGRQRRVLRGHPGGIQAMALTRDGETLASTSEDDFVKLWDMRSGLERQTIKTGYPVWCLAFTPDGKTLVTGGEGPVKVWDVVSGKEGTTMDLVLSKTERKPELTLTMAITADGKTLYTGHGHGAIRAWHLATGKAQLAIRTASGNHVWLVTSIVLTPDDKRLACVLVDGSIGVWDLATREQRAWMSGAQARAWTLALAPDGKTLASGGWDGKIRLWDPAHGSLRATVPAFTDSRVRSLAFTPDGKTLIAGGGAQTERGDVRLWDVASVRKPRGGR
jgi:WD40 repeat protein